MNLQSDNDNEWDAFSANSARNESFQLPPLNFPLRKFTITGQLEEQPDSGSEMDNSPGYYSHQCAQQRKEIKRLAHMLRQCQKSLERLQRNN